MSCAEVEEELQQAMKNFSVADALLNDKYIEELLAVPKNVWRLMWLKRCDERKKFPIMNFNMKKDLADGPLEYGFLNSNDELDQSIKIHESSA